MLINQSSKFWMKIYPTVGQGFSTTQENCANAELKTSLTTSNYQRHENQLLEFCFIRRCYVPVIWHKHSQAIPSCQLTLKAIVTDLSRLVSAYSLKMLTWKNSKFHYFKLNAENLYLVLNKQFDLSNEEKKIQFKVSITKFVKKERMRKQFSMLQLAICGLQTQYESFRAK